MTYDDLGQLTRVTMLANYYSEYDDAGGVKTISNYIDGSSTRPIPTRTHL
jgi:hypothetical protein